MLNLIFTLTVGSKTRLSLRNVTTLWLKFQRESTKLLAERSYTEFLSYAEFFLLLSDIISEHQYSTLPLLGILILLFLSLI